MENKMNQVITDPLYMFYEINCFVKSDLFKVHFTWITHNINSSFFNYGGKYSPFGLKPPCTVLCKRIEVYVTTATGLPTTAGLSRGRSAQRITGGTLPAVQETYSTRCHRKAKQIIKHYSHCLFPPLSSRRRGQYRCLKAGTERLKNSFYLKAIRLVNSHH